MLIGLISAANCMAQEAAINAIIYDWDGSPVQETEGMLKIYMTVGETKKLNFSLEPANADPNSVDIYFEHINGVPLVMENKGYLECIGSGLSKVKIETAYSESNPKPTEIASVYVECNYVGWTNIYPEDTSDPDWKQKGQIAVSYDVNNRFYFWRETLGGTERQEDAKYIIPDYDPTGGHNYLFLWQEHREQVTGLDLNYVDSIGANAFSNLTNLRYQLIPDNVTHLGAGVFLGCTNLKALEMRSMTPPTVHSSALKLNAESGEQIPIIIIPEGTRQAYDTRPWNGSILIESDGDLNNVHWHLGESDSIAQGLQLSIENFSGEEYIVIPDRSKTSDGYPWDELGLEIGELKINDGVSYIGEKAFEELHGLQAIQFNQSKHPLDSLHWSAFSWETMPWKFALGDPQDGPIVPPVVTGVTPENMQEAMRAWEHFRVNTVLYVPDSLFDYKGNKVRAVDLYRNDTFWSIFNKITDRTVDVKTAADSVRLSWLPLENAAGYQITIHKVNCTGNCDTTIVIPATGIQGLIDWANMSADIPQYLAAPQRRNPKGDDGDGGMTLTISIKTGSGEEHNEEAEVSVSGLKEKEDYTYTRGVLLSSGQLKEGLTKTGDFKAPEKTGSGLSDQTVDRPIVAIYDILGRPMGRSLDVLSDGLYIIDNGVQRNTILLRR